MPDRVIRDELLESDRWLDLPTDSHRLVYISLILIADDYGEIAPTGDLLKDTTITGAGLSQYMKVAYV